MKEQNGVCAICGKAPLSYRRLAIDHSHTTNQLRGLLCGTCNPLLAILEDKDWREAALNYLDKHSN